MSSQTPIFLLNSSGELTELRSELYKSENVLQELIELYPSLLAGELFSDPPRRWLLIEREAGIPDGEHSANRWSVDHVFLDQDGIPTLVEVKRSTDSRIRREVIGQMLDYAANVAAFWSVERLEIAFENTCEHKGLDSSEVLANHLAVGVDELEEEAFWQSVQSNLEVGKLRLLFVADEIPRELQRIVEFLNAQMDSTEVLAIELSQYVGGDQRTLVPRLYGKSTRSERIKSIKSAPGERWNPEMFLQRLRDQADTESIRAIERLLEWGESFFDSSYWGKGRTYGNRHLAVSVSGIVIQPLSLQTLGKVQVQIKKSRSALPGSLNSHVDEWVRKLEEIFDYEMSDMFEPSFNAGPRLTKVPELTAATESFIESVREALKAA